MTGHDSIYGVAHIQEANAIIRDVPCDYSQCSLIIIWTHDSLLMINLRFSRGTSRLFAMWGTVGVGPRDYSRGTRTLALRHLGVMGYKSYVRTEHRELLRYWCGASRLFARYQNNAVILAWNLPIIRGVPCSDYSQGSLTLWTHDSLAHDQHDRDYSRSC